MPPFAKAPGRARAVAAPYQLVGPVGSGEISSDSSSSMMSSPQLAITGPHASASSQQPLTEASPPATRQELAGTPQSGSAQIQLNSLTEAFPPAGAPPGLTEAFQPAVHGSAGVTFANVPTEAFQPAVHDPRLDPNLPQLIQQNIHQTAVDASHDIHMQSQTHVEFHEQLNQQVNVQQVNLQGFSPEMVSQVVDQRDRSHAAELNLVRERATAMAAAAVSTTAAEAESRHRVVVDSVNQQNEARLHELRVHAQQTVSELASQLESARQREISVQQEV